MGLGKFDCRVLEKNVRLLIFVFFSIMYLNIGDIINSYKSLEFRVREWERISILYYGV